MKKLLPVIILASLLSIALKSRSETTFIGKDASDIIKGSSFISLKENNKIPSIIRFAEGSEPAFNQPEKWLINNFKLNADFGLEIINKSTDELGITHYRYSQTFHGFPIDGTMWLVHVKSGKIISMNGFLTDHVKGNIQPSLTEQQALSKALNFINASVYKWQVPEEEALLKEMLSDKNATYYPAGKLFYSRDTKIKSLKDYALAYRFDIYSHEPMGRKYVFIDATTGLITNVKERIWEANANGTAVTGYAGTQSIITDNYSGGYRLRETNRGAGQGMETYNLLKGTNYGAAVDFSDNDNFWNNVNIAEDQYATDAHFAAERTYDFYYSSFGRNSINNAGMKLYSYVHYSINYKNAFWDGVRMVYGDGDATSTPLTSLDIGGHEITHGLTSYTANLDYSDEPGALNESFSDCFGTAIEWYADPAHADWLIGEDIGSAFRSHSNPNAYGQPDTYQGTYWQYGGGDNGGVHTNSGVQNFWFYLLSVGGSGTNDIGKSYNVSGIGITKASAIAFRCLTVYLTSTSTYADARIASIQAATDLYGSCSTEMQSTINAWYAVGIGESTTRQTELEFIGPNTFCNGDSLKLIAKANTGSVYNWYRNNVQINSTASEIMYAKTTGNYTVSTNFCGNISNSNSIPVNVVSLAPGITPSGSVSACNNVLLTAQNTSGYNIQWKKNGVPLNGETNATYNAVQNGDYTYTLTATAYPGQTQTNSTQVNIPDNTCNSNALSTITLSGFNSTVATSGISIKINLNHTYDGDLDLMLIAPNGDVLGLSQHSVNNSGVNFVNTVFSDYGTQVIGGGGTTGPFTGTFRPWATTFASCINTTKTSFSSIGNGSINPNGNWTLRAYDRFAFDIGKIVSWSITIPAYSVPGPNCGPVTSPATNVTVNSCVANLSLKMFIEGFYKSPNSMQAAVNANLYPTLCDTVVVQLRNPVAPYSIAYSVKGVINTSGNGTFILPDAANGQSYFIAVRHRNALETWSANPVLITGSTNYDFTTASNKAYGNNMYQTQDNTWAFFSGDIAISGSGSGQDGIVESQDYTEMENAVTTIMTGYIVEDITGDGIVESEDYTIMENNVASIVFAVIP